MATLGRWTGGVKTQGNLPETWTAPANLFDTQQRNDTSAYTFTASTSTLTLPSSGLADGYLLVAHFEYEDTSNGRFNPQGQIVQASGTGNFVGGPTGGYSRDNSEDRSFVRCWAFVDNPSTSSTYQFQWKADTDDATGGTVQSSFEVIPLYYSNHGIYSSTAAVLYGGTTPNQVTGFTAVSQSDTNAIEIVSNVITVKGDNKRYLILGSQFFEGRGGRTQRWHGLEIDNAQENAAKAYSYYRNTSNDESGELFTWLLETATANVTIEQTCYRGDGVGAGQGGANIDGSTPGVGDHATVVLELNDSAEVFRSENTAQSGDLNVTGPVDLSVCTVAGIAFNDTGSWTRASDTAMNAEQAMDALVGANISAAQEVVATTSRWTCRSHFTVNGTEDDDTRAGDYARNNQGSADTFGWSANLLSFVALALNDDVGVSVQELAGGEDGGQYEVQVGWGGFWGVNLDTLQATGGTTTMVADAGSYAWTGSAVDLDLNMPASAGSYIWTGQAAETIRSKLVNAEAGSYSWTGQDAGLSIDRLLSAEAGSYAWTGSAVDLDLTMPAASGSYAWTGQDATLARSITLSSEAGSYSWLGQDAAFLIDEILSAESGSYSWAGQDAALLTNQVLIVEPTSYAWSGQDATLTKSFVVVAEAGSYAWSGQSIDLDLTMPASSGSYSWTGQDVTLSVISGTILTAEPGSYSWSGSAVDFYVDYSIAANSASYSWSGQDVSLSSTTSQNQAVGSRTIDPSTDDWFIDMVYDEYWNNTSKTEIL